MNFLSIPQAANILKKSRQYVWMLVRAKKIPAQKAGRSYILPEEEVGKFKETLTNKDNHEAEN